MSENEPFGRQPQPVKIRITGEQTDVDYWLRQFRHRAEFKGDLVQTLNNGGGAAEFSIFPRAVND